MVAHSTRTIGIIGASSLSIAMIAGAYLLSGPLPFHFPRADAESTHELLVAYASKDTDADGLPDWEEALYGTDPTNAHSVRADVTDGSAVEQGLVKPKFSAATSTPVDTQMLPGVAAAPATLTDRFSRAFFEAYLRARAASSAPLTQEQIASLVETQIRTAGQAGTEGRSYTAADIAVAGTGKEALIAYAGRVEALLTDPSVPYTKNELEYYADAVNKNDTGALAAVQGLAKGYAAAGKRLLSIPVPEEAAKAQVDLANALSRMGAVVSDMGALSSDPMRAMVGIGEYNDAHAALIGAFKELDRTLDAAGVSFAEGDAGYRLYQLGKMAP